MHAIKVEGHTDSVPISGGKYPSNWELSSARASSIVRYLINKFKILPDLMSAVGYADARPVETGKNADIAKNRRVEIVVQRNLHKNLDHYQNTYMKMGKTEQQRRRNEQIKIIREIDNKDIEALGEDIQQTYEETGSEFLDESQRIERLSNPK